MQVFDIVFQRLYHKFSTESKIVVIVFLRRPVFELCCLVWFKLNWKFDVALLYTYAWLSYNHSGFVQSWVRIPTQTQKWKGWETYSKCTICSILSLRTAVIYLAFINPTRNIYPANGSRVCDIGHYIGYMNCAFCVDSLLYLRWLLSCSCSQVFNFKFRWSHLLFFKTVFFVVW